MGNDIGALNYIECSALTRSGFFSFLSLSLSLPLAHLSLSPLFHYKMFHYFNVSKTYLFPSLPPPPSSPFLPPLSASLSLPSLPSPGLKQVFDEALEVVISSRNGGGGGDKEKPPRRGCVVL